MPGTPLEPELLIPAVVSGYVVPLLVLPDGLKVPDVPAVPAVPDVSVPVAAPVVTALPLLVLLALAVMLTGDPLCGSCARI